jgi:hypothetical protein
LLLAGLLAPSIVFPVYCQTPSSLSKAVEQLLDSPAPIEHQYFRPLQPISGSQEYWAAIPDFKTMTTRVGRYDARAFKLNSIIELPAIAFTSQNMWVD